MTAQLVMCLLALQGPVVSFLVPTYKKMAMVACLLSQPWGGRGKKSSAILWPATLHGEFQVSERTCHQTTWSVPEYPGVPAQTEHTHHKGSL